MFEQLPPARQASLLSAWRSDPADLDLGLKQDPSSVVSLLAGAALAIDLETDGERIWEIGCAKSGQAILLHDERGATRVESAMADLGERVRAAPLLVGHNMLSWDWPIIARYIGALPAPLIWDTLLVQYLLEPQAKSHALGGRHRADSDALATAQLFEQQLRRIPAPIARAVLAGEFADTAHLLDAIAHAMRGAVSFACEAPDFLAAADEPSDRLIIVPESRLRETDWLPGATVVAADTDAGIASAWRPIDVVALEQTIQEGGEPSPAARVVLAVARLAEEQGIALRRNMIPSWLLEGDGRLASAIDAACVVPARGNRWCIASVPASVDWWTHTDPAKYTIVGLADDVLVIDRRQIALSDIRHATDTLPSAPFIRISDAGPVQLWLLVDRAAQVLDPRGGFCTFRTLPVNVSAGSHGESQSGLASRPILATRRHHVLHPRAEDQASYWTEVLRTFCEFAAPEGGAVPILLVGSSRSMDLVDLLATGLAELDFGEVRLAHRSQREHLLRASRNGHALVDTLENWPHWQALARTAGVVLQPVIETLPIEEWYACAQASIATRQTSAGDPCAIGVPKG